jgi:hypothetical protein
MCLETTRGRLNVINSVLVWAIKPTLPPAIAAGGAAAGQVLDSPAALDGDNNDSKENIALLETGQSHHQDNQHHTNRWLSPTCIPQHQQEAIRGAVQRYHSDMAAAAATGGQQHDEQMLDDLEVFRTVSGREMGEVFALLMVVWLSIFLVGAMDGTPECFLTQCAIPFWVPYLLSPFLPFIWYIIRRQYFVITPRAILLIRPSVLQALTLGCCGAPPTHVDGWTCSEYVSWYTDSKFDRAFVSRDNHDSTGCITFRGPAEDILSYFHIDHVVGLHAVFRRIDQHIQIIHAH